MSGPEPATHHGPSLREFLLGFVRTAPVTTGLIVASVVVAVLSDLGKDLNVLTWLTLADLRGFDRTIADGFTALARGELWRLITPIIIHFGPLHILFNLLWLKDLGPAIERRWSSPTLLWLVLVSAVASNVAQFVVNWDFANGLRFANALSGGMSGVVYALLGYLWIRGRADPAAGVRLPPTVVWMMLGWLVLCMTGMLGHIGNVAHLVGLVIGMGWAAAAVHLRNSVAKTTQEDANRR
jgi:GlpG protein